MDFGPHAFGAGRTLGDPGRQDTYTMKNFVLKRYEGEKMANQSIIIEFLKFLRVKKWYWLLAIVFILLLIYALIVLTESSVVAPFI